MPITAFIALGSNLGDRRGAIERAVEALRGAERVKVVRLSPVIETAPVGGPVGQGAFLNAACELQSSLDPRQLLDLLLAVEATMGRERRVRWGPRPIDLDLLLFGDRIIHEPGLRLPHPRMHERLFVLEPLAMIAPNAVHPVLRLTIAALLRHARAEAVRLASGCRHNPA